jgi:hypothetical protein
MPYEPSVRLECYGCVLRVEPRGGSYGVAAKIESFWITRLSEKPSELSA